MTRVGTMNEATRVAWLEKALGRVPAGGRILDAGAGERQYRGFCNHLQYVAQDFASYDGNGDSRGLQMGNWDQSGLDIVCDITDIPEPDASFDAIMCVEVLEHLPTPHKALTEFARLLKTGGNLILTAPFCSLTHFAPYHFATGFNSYFYTHHLKNAGFEVCELQANGNYFEYLAQEIRRIPKVAERYSTGRRGFVERVVSMIMLRMLERFSRLDKGSSELLCFGYHVWAKKL